MTIDQLNKLPDEEVRVRVAIRLGYHRCQCGAPNCWWHKDHNEGVIGDFTADLNAAFTLVEKLRGEWNFDLTFELGEWTAEFYAIKCFYSTDHTGARHDNPARAISIAFLAVTEREEG